MSETTLPGQLGLFSGEVANRAEAIFEPSRPQVLEALRAAALRQYLETGEPISANDVRPVLAHLGYTGDQRILGAVFSRKLWRPVESVSTTTQRAAEFGATRQRILAYVPKGAL